MKQKNKPIPFNISPFTSPGTEISPGVYFIGEGLNRDAEAAECVGPDCHGYATLVEATPEEISGNVNCGHSYACCIGVFVCNRCGSRNIGGLESPDMDYGC